MHTTINKTIKKLFITASFISTYAIHSQSLNDITGYYMSMDGEMLTLRWDKTFKRVTNNSEIVTGTFEIDKNSLYIAKQNDSYKLYFVVGTTNLVITKPRSNQAWLFRKITN